MKIPRVSLLGLGGRIGTYKQVWINFRTLCDLQPSRLTGNCSHGSATNPGHPAILLWAMDYCISSVWWRRNDFQKGECQGENPFAKRASPDRLKPKMQAHGRDRQPCGRRQYRAGEGPLRNRLQSLASNGGESGTRKAVQSGSAHRLSR